MSTSDPDLTEDERIALSVHSPNLLALVDNMFTQQDSRHPTLLERVREELADLLRQIPRLKSYTMQALLLEGCIDGLRTPVHLYGRDYTGEREAFIWLGPKCDDGSGAVTVVRDQAYHAVKLVDSIEAGARALR